jgi:Mg-chelatase subunit ChlD
MVLIDGIILLGNGFLLDFAVLTRARSKNRKTTQLMISISDGKVNVNISWEKSMKEIGKILEKMCELKVQSALFDFGEGKIFHEFVGKFTKNSVQSTRR